MKEIHYIFLLFMMYSFIGYLIEIFTILKETKKINLDRGYLIGPYLPIFGFGSMIIVLTLSKYTNDIFILFIVGAVLAGILEYVTSYIMEKFFGMRWWDYSNKKFNLNGRICLEFLILFGLAAILIMNFINPLMISLLDMVPYPFIKIISIILFIIIIIDTIISTCTVFKIKDKFKTFKKIDNTKEIKLEVLRQLSNSSFLFKRLINSFPLFKK